MKKIKKVMLSFALVVTAALILPLLASCNTEINRKPNDEIKAFNSYSELSSYVKSYTEDNNSWYRNWLKGDFATSAPEAVNDSDEGSSETNTQVAGVDESDIVKVYGNYIYTLSYDAEKTVIAVFNTADGNVLKIPCTDYYPSEFYVENGKLVVFGTYYDKREQWNRYAPAVDMMYDCMWYMGSFVTVIYDVSNLDTTNSASVTVARTIKIPNSYYQTSRRVSNTVYLALSSSNLYRQNDQVFIPEYYDTNVGEDVQTLEASEIFLIPHNGYLSYMYLVSFDITETEDAINMNAYLGAAYNFYATATSFYTAASYYNYTPTNIDGVDTVSTNDYKTVFLRFNMTDGKLVFDSKAEVKGYLKDQFSMDEYDNSFRVVATEQYYENQWQRATFLYVFDLSDSGNMTQIGKSGVMGKNENVYSVRFNGTTCNVVTAVQVDPLYVVDITDKTNPTVKKELKSDGVNDYMHILSDDLILGFGRASTEWGGFTGFKASLYYSSGDTLKELLTYADANAYSDLSYQHKALLVFERTSGQMVFGVPLSGYLYSYDQEKTSYSYRSSLVVFKLSKNSADYDLQSTEIGTLAATSLTYSFESGDDWYYADGVRRGVVVNGVLYTVGNTKIYSYNLETLNQTAVYKLNS